MRCTSLTKQGKQCMNHAIKGQKKCSSHRDTSEPFKKELSVVHSKIRAQVDKNKNIEEALSKANQQIEVLKRELTEYKNKIQLIDKVDWYKYELKKLGGSYRSIGEILKNQKYKKEIEDIFCLSQHDAIEYYYELNQERNDICHRFLNYGSWR